MSAAISPQLGLGDCRQIALSEFSDMRGSLVPMEEGADLPFTPVRAFLLLDVPAGAVRGAHAHRLSHEFVLPLVGSVTVELFDGRESRTYTLSSHCEGLYLPPMIWIELFDFTADAVVLALASRPYDGGEYIYDRAAYTAEISPA